MMTSYCLHTTDSQQIFMKRPFRTNLLSTMCLSVWGKLGNLVGFDRTFSTNIII